MPDQSSLSQDRDAQETVVTTSAEAQRGGLMDILEHPDRYPGMIVRQTGFGTIKITGPNR
jgi:hypothetical protein